MRLKIIFMSAWFVPSLGVLYSTLLSLATTAVNSNFGGYMLRISWFHLLCWLLASSYSSD